MNRFMLWIDGVGGHLVCLKREVVLGQAVPGNVVDVPIQADVSRQHARFTRQGEGYLVEPLGGRVSVSGRSVAGAGLIADGDEILLGSGVRIRFRKSHVLSASARLEILSSHRTQPFADAVILMAESCVLGPGSRNHVVCRDWQSDVVLYRSDDRLLFRASGKVEIDGQTTEGRGTVRDGSRIVGSDFAMSVEAV